ncbi:unnamed protein product [Protopolystoma xenopodis]|uniref:Uncharacterized protein n=1 Tax=Protopolystoma xenopodis TaxID=117903 RepID=A0A448X6U4_9PLAT|nr:unnamed protein product [Protopolystoma xenopodis]
MPLLDNGLDHSIGKLKATAHLDTIELFRQIPDYLAHPIQTINHPASEEVTDSGSDACTKKAAISDITSHECSNLLTAKLAKPVFMSKSRDEHWVGSIASQSDFSSTCDQSGVKLAAPLTATICAAGVSLTRKRSLNSDTHSGFF